MHVFDFVTQKITVTKFTLITSFLEFSPQKIKLREFLELVKARNTLPVKRSLRNRKGRDRLTFSTYYKLLCKFTRGQR